jgi:hypothetical protein
MEMGDAKARDGALRGRDVEIYTTPSPEEAVFLFCAEEKAMADLRQDENGTVIGWDFEKTDAIRQALADLKANPDQSVPLSRLVDAIRALRLAAVIGGESKGLPARVKIGDKHIRFIRQYVKTVGRYHRDDLRDAIEREFNVTLDNKKLDRWIRLAEREEGESPNRS